jgi:hypothetical protein
MTAPFRKGRTSMTRKALLALAVATAAAASPAFAHHAFNMYDNSKYVNLTGTVKTWTWKNPHAMIDFVVDKPGGGTELWSIECSSPNIIGRKGWSVDSIKVGDKMPITVHQMKDGSLYALMVKATTPRGETLKDKD